MCCSMGESFFAYGTYVHAQKGENRDATLFHRYVFYSCKSFNGVLAIESRFIDSQRTS